MVFSVSGTLIMMMMNEVIRCPFLVHPQCHFDMLLLASTQNSKDYFEPVNRPFKVLQMMIHKMTNWRFYYVCFWCFVCLTNSGKKLAMKTNDKHPAYISCHVPPLLSVLLGITSKIIDIPELFLQKPLVWFQFIGDFQSSLLMIY